MGSEETHILVFPFPAQGHINPALQFSKRLASKGLRVTLITTTSVSSKPMYIQAGNSVNIESIFDGFNEGELADNMHSNPQQFVSAVSNNLAQLIQTMKHKTSSDFPPPKVLIYDAIMPWCLDIGRRLGLRGGAFFTQMCGVCAIYYHQHQGNLKVIDSADQRSRAATFSLPSLPVLEVKDLPSLIPDAALYPSFLSFMVNQFSNFHQADWLLFNTFDKLEEEVLNWMANRWPIRTVGPTIPSIYLDKRLEDDKDYGLNLFNPMSIEACRNWLDKKESNSVVYASLGSLATVAEEQMEELAMGLKNSNHHFLWVVRASEEGKLPGDFSSLFEKGLVVNWCPQLEVLSHRAVGCFVTHCGWNSTLEALSLGVPIVALPIWTDQTTNAKFIVDVWNVGVGVKVNEKGIVSRQELEFSIKQVMEEGERGNELRKNSARWRGLAKEAVDKGGSSDKNIEALVSEFV